jgi:hypothetical protein
MAAVEAAQEAQAEEKGDLDLDELDAAALAQDATVSGQAELEPSSEDVAGELPDDEFDRAVDAGTDEN